MSDGPNFPPILSQAEIDDYFPDARKDPPPQTFELGLILGGTVSTGAYTAGALDFLIQSLDAWTALKSAEAENPPASGTIAPLHDVRIEIATGASGGSVCAAVLSRALPYEFPPVDSTFGGGRSGNPFYDLWVESFDLLTLLGTQDLTPPPDNPKLLSLLDSTAIDRFAAEILAFPSSAPPPPQLARPYVANPFRIIVTLTNLRGIPYLAGFDGDRLGEYFVDHADYARFAVEVPGGTPSPFALRPDEFLLALTDDPAWRNFAEYAKGSAAFPLGFRARDLTRPFDHYRYRIAVMPDDTGTAVVQALRPAWAFLSDPQLGALPPNYTLTVVDGGALNNEPIELSRTWLSGQTARNPRDGSEAKRAVLLIDPLASDPSVDDLSGQNMLGILFPVINTLIGEARYKTADLVLMADPNVFSRFMLTPKRQIPAPVPHLATGEDAVAGSRFQAFGGFVDKAYRHHDYMLGRANCWAYLRNELTLPADNPLFANWTPQQRQLYGVKDSLGNDYLPIIPLVRSSHAPEAIPEWPSVTLDADQLKQSLVDRIKAVVDRIETDDIKPGFLLAPILFLLKNYAADEIADKVFSTIHDELQSAGLAT